MIAPLEMVLCTGCGALIMLRASYGDYSQPFCQNCWFTVTEEECDDWYGLAPHTHDLSKTGSFIGSTVFTQLPPADEAGWIDCSFMGPSWVGTWFRPDPEDPFSGVYSTRR